MISRAALALVASLVGFVPAAADETLPWQTNPEDVPPESRIPPYLPAPPPLPQPPPPHVFTPPTPAPSAPATVLPPGPVTNYGTGGMQQPPGAPPNPPYPAGGLMH